MSWFWLNMPLAAVFFLAWSGIPLWMVLKNPSWGPERADGHLSSAAAPAAALADKERQPVGSAVRAA